MSHETKSLVILLAAAAVVAALFGAGVLAIARVRDCTVSRCPSGKPELLAGQCVCRAVPR